MTNRAANQGEQDDFSRLFREVQAGRKPIDALFEATAFRKSFEEMVATSNPRSWDHLAQQLGLELDLLARSESHRIRQLESEFDDLLASMQTTKSKRAKQRAFEASPAQLGRAAVKQARKNR